MDKQQIIDYAMHTPGNTNPNVLGSMVESLLDENSGYKVETGVLIRTSGQGGGTTIDYKKNNQFKKTGSKPVFSFTLLRLLHLLQLVLLLQN